MSRLRRASDKTRRDVEAFLAETYPSATAETRLHALICWVYHAPLFESRGSKEVVAAKAAARGVTYAKLRQIVAGDLDGIKWWALEAVLVACGASQADLEVAHDLYDQVRPSTTTIPGSPWTDPAGDGGAQVRLPGDRRSRTRPSDPPAFMWVEPELDPAPGPAWPISPMAGLTGTGTAAGPRPVPAAESPGEVQGEISGEARADDAPPRCGENVPDCVLAAGDAAPVPHQTTEPKEEAPSAPPGPRRQGARKASAPDPYTAADCVEFVALMKKYRVFKGEPPLREMVKVCSRHPKVKRTYSYATFSTIGKNGKLPKREVVCAYIAGCGGSDTEIDQWVRAHTQLSIEQDGA
jgi:hypothetical protein